MKQLVSLLLNTVGTLLFTAWIAMLLLGTLLGNEGLWTPAFWEVVGGLYLVGIISGWAARNGYGTINIMKNQQIAKATKVRKKDLI